VNRRTWRDCACGVGFYGSGERCNSCRDARSPSRARARRAMRAVLNRTPGFRLRRAVRALEKKAPA
jgi:hypothetical protein